ncbi:MAG: hypothetical protein V7K35_04750 [Nostoc sp.]|uniref:hypothetical protein n=1 Tax=Nostoc sp. TaxID=1180 RepID=UPI002FFA1FA6
MFKKVWERLTQDPEIEKLDVLILAADSRIAAKEKYLAELAATNQQLQGEVDKLKDAVSRAEKTLDRKTN